MAEDASPEFDCEVTLPAIALGTALFGRYVLERELGRGGMGVVWLARDTKLGEPVALKFLPDLIARDQESIAELKEETLRCRRLRHPGIVAVYGFEEDDKGAAIVMEYVNGHTLAAMKLAEPGRCFEPEQIAAWVKELCLALDYAHREARLVHRDLKPRNLMVDSAGRLRIMDFGLARAAVDSLSRISAKAQSSGTPPYMSPQQLGGRPATITDDIYSLGATLYDLLTGKPPFYTGNIPLQVVNREPPSMTERRFELGVDFKRPLPNEWVQVVAACLQKDPKMRPGSVQEVLHALEGNPTTGPKTSSPQIPTAGSSFLQLPPITGPATVPADPSIRPSHRLRSAVFAFFILAGLAALIALLWQQKFAPVGEPTMEIAARPEVTVRIPSARGEIRDRNGVTLAANRPSNEVDFYLPDIVEGYQRKFGPPPTIEYMAKVGETRKKIVEPDIVKIVNDAVIPKLREFGLATEYDPENLRDHYRNRALVPFTYQEEVDSRTIAKFSAHAADLPGVKIAVKPVRKYVFGALAAHLLGYVSDPLDIHQLPDLGKYTFYQPDAEGKSQIEYSMDEFLRGGAGMRVLQKNARDMTESEERVDPPKPGDNVYLTLDARIQYLVEQALRHPQLGRAAAVVVDPNNGDILAMASVPSFDPNVLVTSGSKEALEKLRADPAIPLSSRAVSGFPAASTFEIVTALGGLAKKTKDSSGKEVSAKMENARFNCPGGISYGDHYFKCWISDKHGKHGTLGLAEAIKVSCDCYFYQYANAAGMDAIDRIGKVLGIGEHYDLGLQDQKEGVMPGPRWMKTNYPELKWSNAYTANTAIGQGYVLASPLQMAMAYTAVANGGVAYAPRLIKKVLTPEGQPVLDENGQVAVPDQPTIRGDLRAELTKEQLDIVRHGLWLVVNDDSGTGAKARAKGITVAGKTGSARAMNGDNSGDEPIAWFCCFAPFEQPRYVVCAMVQNGNHGGGVAAPIAGHILEQILAMEQGHDKVQLTSLTPAHNADPFAQIEALSDYDHSGVIPIASEEESAITNDASGSKVQMGGDATQPQTRKKLPAPSPGDTRNFLQRFFGTKPSVPACPAPPPSATNDPSRQ